MHRDNPGQQALNSTSFGPETLRRLRVRPRPGPKARLRLQSRLPDRHPLGEQRRLRLHRRRQYVSRLLGQWAQPVHVRGPGDVRLRLERQPRLDGEFTLVDRLRLRRREPAGIRDGHPQCRADLRSARPPVPGVERRERPPPGL